MKTTLNSKCENFFKQELVLLLVTFIISINVNAQDSKPFTDRNPFINPVMKISNLNANEENPMRLDVLNIDIKIVGQIAVTTLEMTYYNTNNRVMEGEFNFPLGEGQTVSRFALDIHGQMREGVVVEKEQGRKTFEAIVRRGVDPGLLEMTEGNNFRSRVYPLPAKGSRKIIIAYEQELADNGSSDLYQLPLKINETVRKFSIHTEVAKQQVKLDKSKNELSNFEFQHWNDSYVADFSSEDFVPDKQVAFSIPHLNDSATVFTTPFDENSDSSWFYINLRPKIFDWAKELPKHITIFWDNSNSEKNRDIDKEISVLDSYIKKIGDVEIELVPFNISVEKSKQFEIQDGNWKALKNTLRNMGYDGATSYGSLDFSKYSADEFLVFSDGISNFGKSEPVLSNTLVLTVNSNPIANHSKLSYIAQYSGGQYINLSKLTEREALKILTESNYHFISATIEKGNVLGNYPSMPCQFNNSFSISGIMVGRSAVIKLNFGFGNKVMYSEKIKISNEKPLEGDILKRIWAEKKLAELNYNEETNKDEITSIGKKFGIVTSNTSLLVLENLSDYIQYKILPPKEMQADYLLSVNRSKRNEKEKIYSHLDYVARLFNTRVNWWRTDFPLNNEKQIFQNEPLPVYQSNNRTNLNNNNFQGNRINIRGHVSDQNGENLPGANVIVKSTTIETVTDINGNFNLNVPSTANSFVVTYVGYKPKEVQINNLQNMEVRLEEDAKQVDEVVVVGYGVQKKSDITSAIASFSAKREMVSNESADEEVEFKSVNNESPNNISSSIQLNAWDPQTPYLKVLQYAPKGQEYATYLKLKNEYGNVPSFYIDASGFFAKVNLKDTAVKVLSNLAEMGLEEPQSAQDYGKKPPGFELHGRSSRCF